MFCGGIEMEHCATLGSSRSAEFPSSKNVPSFEEIQPMKNTFKVKQQRQLATLRITGFLANFAQNE